METYLKFRKFKSALTGTDLKLRKSMCATNYN